MKRFLTLITFLALSLAICAQSKPNSKLAGQQISTRSEKLSDFPLKVTKVVLAGNDFQNIALKEAVRNAWALSPYEFCSEAEFQQLKTSDNYYFLLRTEGTRYPGISCLTLVKGGEKDLRNMLEVFTMPVGAAGASSGSEEVFLTALMSVMQEHVEKALKAVGVRLGAVSGGTARLSRMKLYFNAEDLSPQIDDAFKAGRFGKDMYIIDASGAEDILMSGAYETAVSYVIAPRDPVKGGVCFKLLFDARTFELLYLEKHRLSSSRGAGFLKSDIRKLARHR